MNPLKTAAVLPAYEAAATIKTVLHSLPREYFHWIIVVDDCSKDKTFEMIAEDRSIMVFRNEKNLGYGGNLRKCLGLALEQGADIIVEIHPDGEYGFESINRAINEIKGGAGLVLGNRFAIGRSPLESGMFVWKYPFIKMLNVLANWGLGTRLGDLHQGFRVYSAEFLRKVDLTQNSDGYIFSFQIIAQAIFYKFIVREVPVSCHYRGKKRGARLVPVIVYSLEMFKVLGQFWLARLGMPVSLFHRKAD